MAPAKKINPHIKPLEQAIAARYGWQGAASWRDNLLAAIEQKAARLGIDELAYCRMAVASAAELEALVELLSNSETRFFREPEQFDALKNIIVPRLIGERAEERKLDLWSAACSTGEEAYSLAMVLREILPPDENWKTNLMATDLRGSAIISASQASYPESAIRLIEPDIRSRYFIKAETNGRERLYTVAPDVRRMVTFRRANIYDAKFWTNLHHKFDLIICNNVLIYFHALAIKQTVERIANVLKHGGLLMVMKNEAGYIEHPRLQPEPGLPGSFFRKA